MSTDLQINQSVQADYALLGCVHSNLIANILKMGIHVDEFIEISVSDNGIGIESRYANRIIETLQRLHGTQ